MSMQHDEALAQGIRSQKLDTFGKKQSFSPYKSADFLSRILTTLNTEKTRHSKVPDGAMPVLPVPTPPIALPLLTLTENDSTGFYCTLKSVAFTIKPVALETSSL